MGDHQELPDVYKTGRRKESKTEAPENQQQWNLRSDIRSNPKLLRDFVECVSPGSRATALEVQQYLSKAFHALRTDASPGDASKNLFDTTDTLCLAAKKIKSLSEEDVQELYATLGPTIDTRNKGIIYNSILTTVLGDVLTGLSQVYTLLKRESARATGVEKKDIEEKITDAASALFGVNRLLEKIAPGNLQTRFAEERMVTEEIADLQQSEEPTVHVPHAETRTNKRSTLRATNIPKTVWLMGRLEDVKVGKGEQKRKIREVWNSVIEKAKRYAELTEEIELIRDPAGASNEIAERRGVLISLFSEMRLVRKSLESTNETELKRLHRIGLLTLMTGDMITLYGVIQNILVNDDFLDEKKRQNLRETVAQEQVKIIQLDRKARSADSKGVSEIEKRIREETARVLDKALQKGRAA